MPAGVRDTSVVIDWRNPAVVAALPDEAAVTAITLAGPHLAASGADMLIAATADSNQLALYTRNPDDFAGLTPLVEITAV